jgi:dihydrofolate reductase
MCVAWWFHSVSHGIEAALERAFQAADGAGVRLGGGVSAIQQCLCVGLIDELHLHDRAHPARER